MDETKAETSFQQASQNLRNILGVFIKEDLKGITLDIFKKLDIFLGTFSKVESLGTFKAILVSSNSPFI